jgi:dolichol-phosphate mannosyltransferase
MQKPDSILVVIPTYQERDGIAACVNQVLQQGNQIRVLVVDDNSPDGTSDMVLSLAAANPKVQLRSRQHKGGIGPAYLDGFSVALAQNPAVVVQMDADLSHEPRELRSLIAPILDGSADLVIGSRRIAGGSTEGWGCWRNRLSRFGSTYARLFLRIRIKDSTSGYRAWRPALLQHLSSSSTIASGYGFQVEMAYRAVQVGGVVTEVPITFRERETGRSKMTLGIAIEAAWIVLRLAVTRNPLARFKL